MSAGFMKKHFNRSGAPKKRFDNQEAAEKYRWHRIRSGVWQARKTNTYFCDYCGGYHAGGLGSVHRGRGRKTAKNTPRFLATQ